MSFGVVPLLFLLLCLPVVVARSASDGPRLLYAPDDAVVEEGSPVSFFCRGDGNPLPTISWLRNGKRITKTRYVIESLQGQGLSTLRVEPVRMADSNVTISCTADNAVGRPVTEKAKLTVFKKGNAPAGFPVILDNPMLRAVERGRPAQVTCRVDGHPHPQILWLRDLMPVDARNNERYRVATLGNPENKLTEDGKEYVAVGALMIQNSTEEDEGKYECVARNIHGVAHSKSARLYVRVRRVPPHFTIPPPSRYAVGPGGSVTMTCVAVGYPMPRVFWRKEGGKGGITDLAQAPIGKNVVNVTDIKRSENYTCVAVSKLGHIEAATTIVVKDYAGTPRNLRVTNTSGYSILLSWEPVTPIGDDVIRNYLVQYRPKYSEGNDYLEKVGTSKPQLNIAGLKPFTQYEFRVVAVNSVGRGQPSLPIEAQTEEAVPSSAPKNVVSRALSPRSILVNWDPPDEPNGVLLTYRVFYTNSADTTPLPFWNKRSVKAVVRVMSITDLQPEVEYNIRVQANNSKGFSKISPITKVITKTGIPGQPQQVQVSALSPHKLLVRWKTPLSSATVTGYVIAYNASDGSEAREIHINKVDSSSYTLDKLNPDTEYTFRIAARSVNGLGSYSRPTSQKTKPSVPSAAPAITRAVAIGPTAVRILWSPPDAAKLNGHMTGYRIRWDPVMKPSMTDSELVKSVRQTAGERVIDADLPMDLVLDGLAINTDYRVVIAAGTANGYGPNCPPTTVRTMEADIDEKDVPTKPRSVKLTAVNATAVQLEWEPPLHENGALRGYYIYKEKLVNGISATNRMDKTLIINDPRKTNALITNLEPNTAYNFKITAFNTEGDGEFTNKIPHMTTGLPPTRPRFLGVTKRVTNLSSSEDTLSSFRVVWEAPESMRGSPLLHYKVLYKPQEHINYSTKETARDVRYAVLDGLLMGRKYEVQVVAVNDNGPSEPATEHIQTPVGTPEAPPVNVRYKFRPQTGNKKVELEINWEPPPMDQRNGPIVQYRGVLSDHPKGASKPKVQESSSTRMVFVVESDKEYEFLVQAATAKDFGPWSGQLIIDRLDKKPLIEPPTNVLARAVSDTKIAVQWTPVEGVDGYVIRYIADPPSSAGPSGSAIKYDEWEAKIVEGGGGASHTEMKDLVKHRPYALCLASVSNRMTGECSRHVTVVDRVPKFVVNNLRVEWATHDRVQLVFRYPGPAPATFFVNFTGTKRYLNLDMKLHNISYSGSKDDLAWDRAPIVKYTVKDLRAYTNYTFKVGVKATAENDMPWPTQIIVQTASKAPPFVDPPQVLSSSSPGQARIKVFTASEEYGPIDRYYIIVVWANQTGATSDVKTALLLENRQLHDPSVGYIAANITKEALHRIIREQRRAKEAAKESRFKRALPESAQMKPAEKAFAKVTLGDNKEYGGWKNYQLMPGKQYKVFVRAFAERSTSNALGRPPPTDEPVMMHRDSQFSQPFRAKALPVKHKADRSHFWLAAPIGGILIGTLIICLLFVCWMRRNKKKHISTRHGSISKVAMPMVGNNGGPTETSKLLNHDSNFVGMPNLHPNRGYQDVPAGGGFDMQQSVNYPIGNNHQHHNPMEMHQYAGLNGNGTLPNGGLGTPLPAAPPPGSVAHPPIPITELSAHIDRLKADDNLLFSQEYESIETGQQFQWTHSQMEVNKPKNRYANVVAYDHSRVILSAARNAEEGADYINANYIDGYRRPKAYIASQGPLPDTFADFWRMVWEEGSTTVVMLTRLEERARVKCDQYWPSRGTHTYGAITVQLVDTLDLAHYTIRTFRLQLKDTGEMRDVRQLQFTAWPDHGVPDHPTPFLIFLKRVRALNPPSADAGPIITHCSAGIGRTGAFIAIDCQLDRLRFENTVDIYACVAAMRSQRGYMVQTEEQYVFIHDAVLDAVQSGSTEVPAGKLYVHIQALMIQTPQPGLDGAPGASGMELEFRHLTALKMANARYVAANQPYNKQKNRLVNVLPYDSTRVCLPPIPGAEGSDYINASWIDGYRQRRSYIATQGPLPNTVEDFWRMLWEHNSCIVVMLTKLREMGREKCFQYWPWDNPSRFGPLAVEPIAEYNMPQYVLREFKVTDTQTGQSRTVRHFQYMDWPEQGSPASGELLVEFIGQVQKTREQFGVDGPVTVHCSAGVGRTGVFAALGIVLERMRYENVVDIFTTVKLLRTQRPNMVQSEDQYHFCYQAALEYLGSFDHYALQCE